jgi:hypothetical protein
VPVLLRALAGHPLFIEPALHDVKGCLVDQRLVPALEDLLVGRAALVDDQAEVTMSTVYPGDTTAVPGKPVVFSVMLTICAVKGHAPSWLYVKLTTG